MDRDPKRPTPPDGLPRERNDRDATRRSKVSEVQDPTISGDAGKAGYQNADEPIPDESGQIRKEKTGEDLLH